MPTPKIHVNGQLHQALSSDLLELVIEESLSKPARCLVRFSNVEADAGGVVGYKYFELDDFDFGETLGVWIGVPPSNLQRLFEGRVNRIEGGFQRHVRPEIFVQAEDELYELKMKIRTRIFEEQTDADIIKQIASDHGFTTQIELNGPIRAHITQLNQSDYDFLVERVRAAGGVMRLDQGTLTVAEVNVILENPVELVYGEHFFDFRANADLRDQCTNMGVAGWDIHDKEILLRTLQPCEEGALEEACAPGLRALNYKLTQSSIAMQRTPCRHGHRTRCQS